jgi:hypothetical protein
LTNVWAGNGPTGAQHTSVWSSLPSANTGGWGGNSGWGGNTGGWGSRLGGFFG